VTRTSRGTGVLRAVVDYDDRSEVRCAIDLNQESVFVLSDSPPAIGTPVALRLSFPQMIEPVELCGRAVQVRILEGPGAASGFVCAIDTSTETTQERLRALLAMLDDTDQIRAAERGVRVLLVEDSRFIRDMFVYAARTYFAPRGGTLIVDEAPDVTAAWQMLKATPYDLVLVDYYLPPDCGASLIERIRSDAELTATPIVALSVGGGEARAASLIAGADLFLDKPIVLRDLFRTVEFLMNREGRGGAA